MTRIIDRFILIEQHVMETGKHTPGWRARKRREKPARCDCCHALLYVRMLKRCHVCRRRRGEP